MGREFTRYYNFLKIFLKRGKLIEISWPRTWEMVNVKLNRSSRFPHFSGRRRDIKSRGTHFPYETCNALIFWTFSAGNCILHVGHILARSLSTGSSKKDHRFQSLLTDHFRWWILHKLDLLENAFLVLTFINALQRQKTDDAEIFVTFVTYMSTFSC